MSEKIDDELLIKSAQIAQPSPLDGDNILFNKSLNNEKPVQKKQTDSKKIHKQLGISSYFRPYRLPEEIENNAILHYQKAKRTTDVLCSFLAIVLLSPFMVIIALVIFIDDPRGSPIFMQKRTGKGGKEFNFYKFRSMFVDAEKRLPDIIYLNEVDGPAFKIKDDPRITRIGRLIRNSSIDELPQLFNIIKGDMSLVGPRPPIPREVEKYDEYQRQRLNVKPGLTCLWQVFKDRHDLSFDEWVALDIKYAAEHTYWMDWKLMFRTIVVIFQGNVD